MNDVVICLYMSTISVDLAFGVVCSAHGADLWVILKQEPLIPLQL